MSNFFYDLNKKLASIENQPAPTQLNERGEKWIQKAVDPSHKGDLHKALHVPQGEKIPAGKLEKATHSSNPKLKKQAVLAKTLRGLKKEDVEEGQLDEKFGGNAAQNAQYNKAHTGEWNRSPDRLQNRQDDIEAGNLPPEELKKRMQDVAKYNIRNTWPGHQTKSKLPGAARPAYRGPDNPYAESAMDESAFQAAIGKKKYGDEGMKALQKAGRDHASAKTMSNIRNKYDKYDESVMADEGNAFSKAVVDAKKDGIQPGEKITVGGKQYPVKETGPMDAIKKVGKGVASGVNRLVGHGSDEEMIRDLQRKSGAPVTGKKPQNFADKIAGAKKEVDEMLGDVAAEAMRSALGGGKGRNAAMDEENDFTAHKRPAAVQPKVGSTERGHKHDIKHTATGRMVTRRTDAQGNSVGADDDTDTQAAPRGPGRPKGPEKAPERVTAKATKHKSGRKMADEALDSDGVMMTRPSNMSSESRDPSEYDQEGSMAKDDIHTIVRHAKALEKILSDNDNLPEWVQAKLAKIEGMMTAVDDYMQDQRERDVEHETGEEGVTLDEKAVSKKQQRFMGMAHAIQKGEKVKGAGKELKKVANTMKPKDTEDFAKTKHKGLPEKAPKKKKEVEENTTAGSVATSTGSTKSKGGFSFGQGVYESLDQRYKQALNEGMSINISMDEQGHNTLNVTATDEDAQALAQLLKMAGLGSQGHGCPSCGEQSCGCDQMVDENQPNWPTNTETSHDAMQYSGGLNGPKSTGQATTPVLASQMRRQHSMEESVKLERSLFNTWKNYKG